ncbi:MAG: beta-ketoacyl-ACP synthase III [Cytophagaceae bacterium]
MFKEVFITNLSKFLPNDPVSVDEMEGILGMIDNKPSKARRLVLRNNGIKTRYYAIDKEGNITHTNAELAAEAIKRLCTDDFKVQEIEMLCSGTSVPDQIMPSHGMMVHGLINASQIEVFSPAGNCCSSMHGLKIAYLSVMTGNSSNAVVTGSELLSPILMSKHFRYESRKVEELEEKPILAFEKDFLRWMLSDGSGAALLQNKPAKNGISFKIDWIETFSFANEYEVCMYAGGVKGPNGEFKSYKLIDSKEWLTDSVFAMKQDVRLLDKVIVEVGIRGLQRILQKKNYDVSEIDYFLPHISSEFFRGRFQKTLNELNINIPQEKWFTNLTTVGNIGSASIFVMLEELKASGKLRKGQKILLGVPESARFSYACALLTVV